VIYTPALFAFPGRTSKDEVVCNDS